MLVRKPLIGTVAENVQAHGTGAINVDGCRIGRAADDISGWSTSGSGASENLSMSGGNYARDPKPDAGGRWPANLILSHAPECERDGVRKVKTGTAHEPSGREKTNAVYGKTNALGRTVTHGDGDGTETVEAWRCVLWCPVREMDAQSGVSKSTGGVNAGTLGKSVYGKFSGTKCGSSAGGLGDTGGASRFFYCPKPSRAERSAGLPDGERNTHPTVKSQALMTYLIRLITPPGGLVLDPFTGSGSTGVAAVAGGWRFLGIEREPEYARIAEARIGNLAAPSDGERVIA